MVSVCLAVVMAVALVLLAAHALAADSRALLLGVSLVLGGVRAFQMPAQQALTPLLVPPALLPRAMAFSASGVQAAIIGGPARGGAVSARGPGVVYGACVLLSGAASLLMAGVRYEHQPPERQPVRLATLLAGVRFIGSRKPVLGAISLDLFAVLLGGAVALLPIFAKDILHTGPWGLGLLRSAPAVGALGMSLWLTRHPPERGIGRRLLLAVGVFGACMAVFGLSRWFWLSLAVLAISGAADMVSVVIRQTLVQIETPDAMRGRVSAVNSIFIGASNQLGEFEFGATAAAGPGGCRGAGRRGHHAGGGELGVAVPRAGQAGPHGRAARPASFIKRLAALIAGAASYVFRSSGMPAGAAPQGQTSGLAATTMPSSSAYSQSPGRTHTPWICTGSPAWPSPRFSVRSGIKRQGADGSRRRATRPRRARSHPPRYRPSRSWPRPPPGCRPPARRRAPPSTTSTRPSPGLLTASRTRELSSRLRRVCTGPQKGLATPKSWNTGGSTRKAPLVSASCASHRSQVAKEGAGWLCSWCRQGELRNEEHEDAALAQRPRMLMCALRPAVFIP